MPSGTACSRRAQTDAVSQHSRCSLIDRDIERAPLERSLEVDRSTVNRRVSVHAPPTSPAPPTSLTPDLRAVQTSCVAT